MMCMFFLCLGFVFNENIMFYLHFDWFGYILKHLNMIRMLFLRIRFIFNLFQVVLCMHLIVLHLLRRILIGFACLCYVFERAELSKIPHPNKFLFAVRRFPRVVYSPHRIPPTTPGWPQDGPKMVPRLLRVVFDGFVQTRISIGYSKKTNTQ